MATTRASQSSVAIGNILTEVLRQTRQRHTALTAIQKDWAALVGTRVARHTKPVSLRQGRLVVQADHAGDGFLLRYAQPRLLEQLCHRAQGAVKEIIIKPADPTTV